MSGFEFAAATGFGLEIDGIQINAFTEVSDLKVERETKALAVRTPNGQTVYTQQFVGGKPCAEITVTRPFTADRTFSKWYDDVNKGVPGCRKGGAIIVYDNTFAPIARWTFNRAFPKAYATTGMGAEKRDTLMEKITIVIEDLEIK